MRKSGDRSNYDTKMHAKNGIEMLIYSVLSV